MNLTLSLDEPSQTSHEPGEQLLPCRQKKHLTLILPLLLKGKSLEEIREYRRAIKRGANYRNRKRAAQRADEKAEAAMLTQWATQ